LEQVKHEWHELDDNARKQMLYSCGFVKYVEFVAKGFQLDSASRRE